MKNTIDQLSLTQLKFSQAGMNRDTATWLALEATLPLEQQSACIEALALEPNPGEKVKRLIIARGFQRQRQRNFNR